MKKILLILIAFLVLLSSSSIQAAPTTASAKGFNTEGLEYFADFKTDQLEIHGKSDEYGSIGLWTGVYLLHIGDITYVIVLLDGYISSIGKSGSDYFRNKDLNYTIELISPNSSIVDYSPRASSQTKSETYSYDLSVEASENFVGVQACVGYSSDVTYNTLNHVCKTIRGEASDTVKINTRFTQWEDGKMMAPNIGEVNIPALVIYEVEDFDYNNAQLQITLYGEIFKDKTWWKNYYDEATIFHTYNFNDGAKPKEKVVSD